MWSDKKADNFKIDIRIAGNWMGKDIPLGIGLLNEDTIWKYGTFG